MTDPVLTTEGDRPSIRLERRLTDPPNVVWRALTEPEKLARWFPCQIQVEGGTWRVGAALTFPFPPEVIEMTLTGEVLELNAPHLLVYTWGPETLRFELLDDDGGTRLLLTDVLDPASAARNAAGWDDCLDLLAGGAPPDRPAWQARFERYAASFEPIVGPQDGPPDGYTGG
jgi:uncharacterized protein YndB with AHSA1/START domain